MKIPDFYVGDIVINKEDNKEYCIEEKETIYDVDNERYRETGYASCRLEYESDGKSQICRFFTKNLIKK